MREALTVDVNPSFLPADPADIRVLRQAVKSFGKMLSPCFAPLSSLIFLLSRCRFKVEVAPLYRSRSTVMYAGSTRAPWLSWAVNSGSNWVKSLFIIHKSEAQWDLVFTSFLLGLTYSLDVVDCGKAFYIKAACSRGWWLSSIPSIRLSRIRENTL